MTDGGQLFFDEMTSGLEATHSVMFLNTTKFTIYNHIRK